MKWTLGHWEHPEEGNKASRRAWRHVLWGKAKALHVQAGPTSFRTPNASLGLIPRREAWQRRTDAEFKLQIDSNSLKLQNFELEIGRTVWRNMKTAFQCAFSWRESLSSVCREINTQLVKASSWVQHCTVHEWMQVPTAAPHNCWWEMEDSSYQPGHLKKHWESSTQM